MKPLSADSFLGPSAGRLRGAIIRQPRVFVWPQILLLAAASTSTAHAFLKFDTDRDNLGGSNNSITRIFAVQKGVSAAGTTWSWWWKAKH